tara:strand:+ start:186 stop:506 length:321 start_codon:yes stop_codon:yes gene_type:complete
MAKPENNAPKTKYGGKIVVCHPGKTAVAKSVLTIECTEKTNGVANPANINDTDSNLCQSFAPPLHPNDNKEYIFCVNGLTFLFILSRNIAKSGINPKYQKTIETVK